ncbi:nucleotidyltransferase domain-containing protein [Gottfriedia acidiceleris]|uniref:nucleotidyltransferase domain-containing protein n=1 Tax=Gottfriedia acidiceleris TaxID=371036 RepID=UPI002FFF0699
MVNLENNNLIDKQLKILNEINTICLNLTFHLWLRGGWAIDFLLGKVTREHSDIDLVTFIQYREVLELAMVNAGFKKIPVSMLQTDFIKDEVDVSFVFVRISEEGKIIANGFPDWVWRKDALPIQTHNLKGISMNALSPYQLLEEKKVYEKGTGRKLRPKDIESMKVIQGIIDSMS